MSNKSDKNNIAVFIYFIHILLQKSASMTMSWLHHNHAEKTFSLMF